MQVTTHEGALVTTTDSTTKTQAGLMNGSTAPFTTDENHGLTYRSGMIQSLEQILFHDGIYRSQRYLPWAKSADAGLCEFFASSSSH
ncbi:hypothetical protein BDZ97DRAFT_1815570 [Flammula alnicola]|nr:hypothetical protein BDZ97DRAFT_1815570 [Flammula alnicola]